MFKAVLLDIEGTIVPTDFIENTLKPFARERLPEFVRQNYASLVDAAQTEYAADAENSLGPPALDASMESLARYFDWLADTRPASSLFKSVREKIWQSGYESGELETLIFADIFPALEKWRDAKIPVALFSSVSVLSQKLLLSNTEKGDLTPLVSAFFDVNAGRMRDPESYRKIAAEMSFPQVENFLFVSDTLAELDAARKAGFQTALSLREGSDPIEEETTHRIIQNLAEIVDKR